MSGYITLQNCRVRAAFDIDSRDFVAFDEAFFEMSFAAVEKEKSREIVVTNFAIEEFPITFVVNHHTYDLRTSHISDRYGERTFGLCSINAMQKHQIIAAHSAPNYV